MADIGAQRPGGGVGSFKHGLAKLDRVLLTAAAIMVAVLVFDGDRFEDVVVFTGEALVEIAIFIVISVGLAGYLKASGADNLIAKAFSGGLYRATVLAALFGALSPFCSCGVIPLIAALLASGVPLAPVMAFWLASPIMDPEMFILTAAVIGPEFAIIKTVAALGMGLLGGFTVIALGASPILRDPLIGAASTCGARAVTNPKPPVWSFWREAPRRTVFAKEIRVAGLFLFKWLTLAFVLEAIMVTYVPMQEVGAWLAGLGAWAIPAAAMVGVPSYLNGYAAIPLADALMDYGLSAPAAMTFMVAGGVTCIPAAVAVKALVRTPVFGLYIAIAMAGSLAVGFLFAALSAIAG
ncbi:MAG: permease [Alphaproteobacteria bacterium]|nr:permease [Alphaproteobacteria bacterium]